MSSEEQQTTTDPLRPHIRTFKPSGFQTSQFEVVADGKPAMKFAPDQFVVIEATPRGIDPMFDAYDGLVTVTEEFVDEEVVTQIETTTFIADIEIAEDGESNSTEPSVGDGDDVPRKNGGLSGTPDETRESQAVVDEEVVPVSELELLQQRFEEERQTLHVEHERQLEELKASLQREISARLTAEHDERMKAVEERYRTIIDDMGGQIRQEVEGVERRAVEFAIQVARKLVGTIVEINPEYILQVIQDAVKLTGGATIKAIRVSPQDLEFIKMLSPEKQFKEFDGSWSFQSDDTIRAGCVVETSSGEVEFDLDKAWERIKESVTKVR